MQVSGKAVMCESQIESVLGTEHPATLLLLNIEMLVSLRFHGAEDMHCLRYEMIKIM